MKNKNNWDPKYWQGRSEGQVKSDEWISAIAVGSLLILLGISAIIKMLS